MNVQIDSESILVLLKDGKMRPYSSLALNASTKTRKKLSDLKDAIILYKNGHAKIINSISVLGLYGHDLQDKVKSLFTGIREVKLELHETNINNSEIKERIVKALNEESDYMSFWHDSEQSHQEVIENIRKADALTDIFEILSVPDSDDCLQFL